MKTFLKFILAIFGLVCLAYVAIIGIFMGTFGSFMHEMISLASQNH